MNHTFSFNDTECLVALDALRHLMDDENRHELDRRIAGHMSDVIKYTVSKDKENIKGDNNYEE